MAAAAAWARRVDDHSGSPAAAQPNPAVDCLPAPDGAGAGLDRRRLPNRKESIDATAYPPPGQLIDVGGHRLHLNCTGSGSPTVVLEPGLGEVSPAMGWIAPVVARDTRVCVYDRAGRGWSDPADGPQDAAQTAADLHTLLDRGHIPGPYVLAGHSFGGLYVLTFAATYPDQVAGLVLLDSTAPVPGPVPQPRPGPTTSSVASPRCCRP